MFEKNIVITIPYNEEHVLYDIKAAMEQADGEQGDDKPRMHVVRHMQFARVGKQLAEFCDQIKLDEFVKSVKAGKPHTMCEYMSSAVGHSTNEFTKIYLDRNIILEGDEPPSAELLSKHECEVRDKVHSLIHFLHGCGFSPLAYVLATRHGQPNPDGPPGSKGRKHKLSFRPFIQGIVTRYADIPVIIRAVDQQDFWDMSPYKPGD